IGRITADRAIGDEQISKPRTMDTTPERVAADGAIGNCHLYTTTEDDAAPLSKNTAPRIIAHRGAAHCNGKSCKFLDVVRNTDGVVVTHITIYDRQAGCAGRKSPVVDPVARVAA